MADQYTKTQLAKIVAPNLNDPSNYAGDLQKAFLAINENFKKIATMPFVQGVQGDSYKLDIRHIFENDVLTKDGAELFNSIFDTIDTDLFKENMLLSTCISICKSLNLGLNGVTPLDGFLNGNEINKLYFYSIYNDEGVATNSYLGQLYYFVDSRLLELGDVFASNPNSLINFVDYSGFYRYEPITETTGKYVKTEILPTIYYDAERNDICWKLNGKETGISAVGAKGIDGTDASLTFVLVEPQNYEAGESGVSAVTGVFKYGEYNETVTNTWSREEKDIKAIDNGVALICIKPQRSTVEYFAFGVIRTDGNSGKNAYWNSDTVLDNFLEDEKINNYFSRIGYEENASSASCLSIPAILYYSISENANDIRHTISTTADLNHKEKPGDLLFRMIYKDISGNYKRYGVDEQVDGQAIKNFRIDNYNLVVQRIGSNGSITSSNPGFGLTEGFTKIAPAEIYLSKNNDPEDPEGSNFTKLSCEEDSRFGAGLRVNGDFTVHGQTNLNNKTTIEGNLTLNGNMNVKSDKQIVGGGNPTGKGHFWRGKENAFILHDGYSSDGVFYPVVTVKATNNGAYYSTGTYNNNFILEYIPKEVHEGTKSDDDKNRLIKIIKFDPDSSGINVFVSGKATINGGASIAGTTNVDYIKFNKMNSDWPVAQNKNTRSTVEVNWSDFVGDNIKNISNGISVRKCRINIKDSSGSLRVNIKNVPSYCMFMIGVHAEIDRQPLQGTTILQINGKSIYHFNTGNEYYNYALVIMCERDSDPKIIELK